MKRKAERKSHSLHSVSQHVVPGPHRNHVSEAHCSSYVCKAVSKYLPHTPWGRSYLSWLRVSEGSVCIYSVSRAETVLHVRKQYSVAAGACGREQLPVSQTRKQKQAREQPRKRHHGGPTSSRKDPISETSQWLGTKCSSKEPMGHFSDSNIKPTVRNWHALSHWCFNEPFRWLKGRWNTGIPHSKVLFALF